VRPRRVALLSPCGWGNLGDAAILDSVIDALRRRAPEAAIVAFTQNPSDTTRRHGIPAHTLLGFSPPLYEVAEEGEGPPLPSGAAASRASSPSPSALRLLARRFPGLRATYLLARDLLAERAHRRKSLALLAGCDAFVVAGGGQLDDSWGGPFGHPYALYRWSSLARRAGAPFLLVSVGTGKLGALSRFFVRGALARAQYLSFRDLGSRSLAAEAADVALASIVPDLAFGVPVPRERLDLRAGTVVGVSPMPYRAPRAWFEADDDAYRGYLAALAKLVQALLGRGHAVALFATGGSDARTIRELVGLVEPALPEGARSRLLIPPVRSVASLLGLLAGLDAVVASRLHGVLLSHVAGRPCLAIPHERKVRVHMAEMDQADACLDIHTFDPFAAADRVERLLEEKEALSARIRREVEKRRTLVERQYDALFGEPTP
jgi:polysaccharide pyruvyl transferase WcaK-like protein